MGLRLQSTFLHIFAYQPLPAFLISCPKTAMISKLLAKLMCNALPLLAFFPLLGNSLKGLIPFQTQTPEPAAGPYSGLGVFPIDMSSTYHLWKILYICASSLRSLSLPRAPLPLNTIRKMHQMPPDVSYKLRIQATRYNDCHSAHCHRILELLRTRESDCRRVRAELKEVLKRSFKGGERSS